MSILGNFKYECDLSNSNINTEEIERILPKWRTNIIEIYQFKEENKIEIQLLIAAKTVDDIKKWVKEYEFITKCTYSIRSSSNGTGIKVHFKQRLHCQHNTTSNRIYDPIARNRTRNTNCPSFMVITLHVLKPRYHGKNKMKALLNPDMLCEIRLVPTHNHNTECFIHFRRVSVDTSAKLLEKFDCGHTPKTALESLRIDILMCDGDSEGMLADRYYYPEYMFCYHLYMNEYMTKFGSMKSSRDFLIKKVEEYNNLHENTALLDFEGDNFAICICTPLMKRIHSHIYDAGDEVYIDSIGIVDKSRVFTLLTHTACGGLPLAIFITSCESTEALIKSFNLLKRLLGNDLFGGRVKGPKIFLTSESTAEEAAVKEVYPNSIVLPSKFHVLQSIWRCLINTKNSIPGDEQQTFYQEFRAIMYSSTIKELNEKYKIAFENAEFDEIYFECLQKYWLDRKSWVLLHRAGSTDNDVPPASVRLIKDKLFGRVGSFNSVQMIDFIYNNFNSYYEECLLNIVMEKESVYGSKIRVIPPDLKRQVQKLHEEIFVVPSEDMEKMVYVVNMEIMYCTCNYGRSGKICKHIEWIFDLQNAQFRKVINDEELKNKFRFVATGDDEDRERCEERSLVEGTNLVQEIGKSVTEFLKQSPTEVKNRLHELNLHLSNITTISEFTSACNGFTMSPENLK